MWYCSIGFYQPKIYPMCLPLPMWLMNLFSGGIHQNHGTRVLPWWSSVHRRTEINNNVYSYGRLTMCRHYCKVIKWIMTFNLPSGYPPHFVDEESKASEMKLLVQGLPVGQRSEPSQGLWGPCSSSLPCESWWLPSRPRYPDQDLLMIWGTEWTRTKNKSSVTQVRNLVSRELNLHVHRSPDIQKNPSSLRIKAMTPRRPSKWR